MTASGLPTQYQEYIHGSRYARWDAKKGRRETWPETVDRYLDFFGNHLSKQHGYSIDGVVDELREGILNLGVMPSMRCLMTAGKALERDNVAGYNCSYVAVDDVRVFSEILYVLMCGTGVGFSAERQYVNKLPEVPEELYETDTTVVVADSKIGWAKALDEYIRLLYSGVLPKWDTSKVRPAGAPLKTFGGRASGPEPLEKLFRFTRDTFKGSTGRKLSSIECHDLVCMIADIVIVGGVRRSALISLSNLSDDRMRSAKNGEWWNTTPHRRLANNSAAYTEKPDIGIFMKEWSSLYESKSGERGIFNRQASQNQVRKSNKWRDENFSAVLDGHRDPDGDFGTNPCSEIILLPAQFCNLTEIVARADDSLETLLKKARLAAIMGTWQSTLTKFRYLSARWKKNTESERLLGVSITGIMDHPVLNGSQGEAKLRDYLDAMKQEAVKANFELAQTLGIPVSKAITCVKPSGTVSQLADCASGIHSRHSEFYIRRVRADVKDPLALMMVDQGVPHEIDVMNPHNYVFSFPIRSPKGCVTRDADTAMGQLNTWMIYQDQWCEHKPSVTVSVREDEWMKAGAWVYEHFDTISGISFLPYDGGSYAQAPYEECNEATIIELEGKMPVIDWSQLKNYESSDMTESAQTLACVAGQCEI